MGNSFSLDDINEAAEKKYGPVTVNLPDGPVELTQILRLPEDRRTSITKLFKKISDLDSADLSGVAKAMEDLLRAVATDKTAGDRLIAALGGDLAKLQLTFERYQESTQLGNA